MDLFKHVEQLEKDLSLSHFLEAVRNIVNSNNVNRRDRKGNTILHHLMRKLSIHEDVVKLLMDIGAQVNAKNRVGQSTLHCALKYKNCKLSIVRLFVERGADVQLPDSDGFTALFYAVANKNCLPDVIEFLAEKSDIQTVDKSESNVLHHALMCNCSFNNIKMLVDMNVDIHAVNNDSETALHLAAFTNRADVVKLLLEKPKIKLDLLNNQHYTPLHLAVCRRESDPEVVRLLLKAGADILKKTKSSKHVLHFAAYSGNPAMIKLLLEYDARVNVLNADHTTPLDLACATGSWVAVKLLLCAGALVFSDHQMQDLLPQELFPIDRLSPLHGVVEEYNGVPSEENLQHILLLLKYALLERPLLHFNDCEDYFRANEETINLLEEMKSTYLHELQQMVCVEPDTTLAQFILRMRLREDNECQTDQILEVLSSNAFPIYKEVIVGLLRSRDLKDGLQKHLIYMESDDPDPSKRVRLNFDPLCGVVSYLSDEDLLNLLFACYNKRKNITSPMDD